MSHLSAFRKHLEARRALDDPGAFRVKALGFKDFNWYRNADRVIANPGHAIIMAPPGSGKTRGITVQEAARHIAKHRDHRVGIFSKAKDKAAYYMKAVEMCLRSPEMEAMYGKILDNSCVCNTEQIRVLGCDPKETTPSIANMGMGGQVESMRFHLMLLDDPIDRETAFSEAEVEKFVNRMQGTFLPRLEPGGKMIIVGSRFTKYDGYDWFLSSSLFPNRLILPSIVNGASTIPERFSVEQLLAIKEGLEEDPEGHAMSTSMFEARFQQNPQSGEAHPFKPDWIEWTHEDPRDLVCIDPAYTTSKKSDYTGGVAIARHINGTDLVITHMLAERVGGGFAAIIADFSERVDASRTKVEVNNAKTLGDQLRTMGRNCIDVNSTGNKHDRIDALEFWFKRPVGSGKILFHIRLQNTKEYDLFFREYVNFPTAAHDHILDAIQMGVAELGQMGYTGKKLYRAR